MTETTAFHYKCDGDCGRSIGDIGAFIWYHLGEKDYCPACFSKLAESEKMESAFYMLTEKTESQKKE